MTQMADVLAVWVFFLLGALALRCVIARKTKI